MWLDIFSVLIREQRMADATFSQLENKVWFEMHGEIIGFFVIKQIN